MNLSYWNQPLPGILLLGLVIFVHELGHFLMAKWRGVRVLRFSMGFGPKLVGFTRGETEYWLSWIPLGGYVQMAGDTPDPDGRMPGHPDEFLSHPWFGRVLIAIAGPAANLVTACLIMIIVAMTGVSMPDYPNLQGSVPDTSAAYALGLREGDRIVAVAGSPTATWHEIYSRWQGVPAERPLDVVVERGEARLTLPVAAERRASMLVSMDPPSDPPIVGDVSTGMPAYKAGIKVGDRILAVGGTPIKTWNELPLAFRGQVDRKVPITLEREGRRLEVVVTPMDPEGKGRENGRIGIGPLRHGTYIERYAPLKAIQIGAGATVSMVASVYEGMWRTISRPLYYREYVGGPLFIAQAALEQARRGLDSFWQFVALINVAIMAFNLLPLPVLDGGHILLAVIEAVRRQAISARAYLRFQKVGLAFLGTLLVLILANDPLRVLHRLRAIDQQSTQTERPVVPANP